MIENGGGYDSFVDTMIDASGSTAPVITATVVAGLEEEHDHEGEAADAGHDEAGHEHAEYNEHVWYDVHTVVHVAEAIADRLSDLDPDGAADYAANAAALVADLEAIEARLADVGSAHEAAGVFITETVPGYLASAAGLADVAPEDFAAAVEKVRVGDPFAEGIHLGPLASAAQRDRVQGYIQKGIDEGATVVAGGTGAPEGLGTGFYVRPTVFSNVTPDMTIAQEEIFGPVLSVMPYSDEDEAVDIANSTVYGLAGAVFAGSQERGVEVARRMRTGQVDVNGGAFNPTAPFGGYKQSGTGRELGRYGLEEFLEVKSIQL